jgi:hypothetical protein
VSVATAAVIADGRRRRREATLRAALRRRAAGWAVRQGDAALLECGTDLREPAAVRASGGSRRRLPAGWWPVARAAARGKGHALLRDAGTSAGTERSERAARPLGLLGRGS